MNAGPNTNTAECNRDKIVNAVPAAIHSEDIWRKLVTSFAKELIAERSGYHVAAHSGYPQQKHSLLSSAPPFTAPIVIGTTSLSCPSWIARNLNSVQPMIVQLNVLA